MTGGPERTRAGSGRVGGSNDAGGSRGGSGGGGASAGGRGSGSGGAGDGATGQGAQASGGKGCQSDTTGEAGGRGPQRGTGPQPAGTGPQPGDAARGDETANRWAVLALAGTAAFMTTLDSSIVNISLPAIAHTFGIGSRWLSPVGLAVACVGLVLLSQLGSHSSTRDIIGLLLLTGGGQAIFMSPNTRALMGSAPRAQQGSASGLVATSRTVGQSLSVAMAGAVFAILGGAAAGATLDSAGRGALGTARVAALQRTFLAGFHDALMACALCAAGGVVAALLRGDERAAHAAQAAAAQAAAALE